MSDLTITIPGELRGKQRPRATRQGRVYTPAETVNAEAWVKQCAVSQGVVSPLDGPLSISVAIQRAVPASWSRRRRELALSGGLMPTGKPDLDNCIKLLCDALNKIAWLDDAQIVSISVRKSYAPHSFTTLVVEKV